jgi:alkylation response protein AidB-like acyl-CoA dehydrogenase
VRFAPTAEQRHFADSLHDLLGHADVPAAARAVAAGDVSAGKAVWKQLAEVGLPALLIPERWGGLDAGTGDVVVAFEEIGHHAVPGPLVESAVFAPVLLRGLARDHPGLARRLTGLAEGDTLLTVAHSPGPRVVGASWVDEVLVVRGDELLLVSGESLQQQRSVDPSRQIDALVGSSADSLASGPDVSRYAAKATEVATLAASAQLLGAARRMLELSTEYAGQRTQFGRRIGEFQAVKHHLADVAVAVEFTRPVVHGAAVALMTGSPDARRDVSAAKITAARTADRAARTALQVHGAIGYTQEHDLSVWLLQVRALVGSWGTTNMHRARVLAALTAADAEEGSGADAAQ